MRASCPSRRTEPPIRITHSATCRSGGSARSGDAARASQIPATSIVERVWASRTITGVLDLTSTLDHAFGHAFARPRLVDCRTADASIANVRDRLNDG